MPAVVIENVQAIRDLVIDIPDDSGGVLVLKGKNRAGKSTVLEIIRKLLVKGKPGPMAVSDGETKGSVEGFGRRASVGSKTTYRGETDTPSIEGKFDFSDLVSPQAKEPETRDKIRMKALLTLTGVKAEPKLFYELVPGGQAELERIVSAEKLKKTDDIVELAAIVAKGIHEEAKRRESDAEHAAAHAASCKEAAGDVDPNTPIDTESLHRESQAAASVCAALEERSKAAKENEEAIEEARVKLEAELADYSGPSQEEATAEFEAACTARSQADQYVVELKASLKAAEDAAKLAASEQKAAQAVFDAADQHFKLVAELEGTIGKANDDAPSLVELDIAERKKKTATEALELAIANRDKQVKAKEAKEHKAKATAAQKAAESYREAARSVDTILSTKLPAGPLKAKAGRLVLDTERGEGVPYDECSEGEKNRVALPYGIQSVGPGGYLVLIQSGWQDLDHEHRVEVATICRDHRVWLITGEVATGELRTEPFALEA